MPRLFQLVRKEIIHFQRDILMSFFILLVPVAQFFLMAHETGREVRHLRVAVLDWDNTSESRCFISIMDETERLDVSFYPRDERELRRLLDTGQAVLGVIIPKGFGAEMCSFHTPPPILAIADGSNDVSASLAFSGLYSALEAFTKEKVRSLGLEYEEKVRFEPHVIFNPTYNVRHFTLPAQVGFIVYQITLAIASLGLARERELGTLEQLIVSPLPRIELVLGKAIPALLIGLVNFGVLLLVAMKVYGVPMKGSLVLLIGITFLFLMAEVGWGITISTFSRTQQQAILFVFLQAMFDVALSGFIVPVRNMPSYLRAIAHFIPLQHYLNIIRQIMLKGATLADLWPRVVTLIVLGGVMLTIAAINIGRRLE
ncbi:MAG TPA: ABC transporter permease [Chloroflexi bacterium]|nr:ABC transporter permease [Chloroflexota bacterium]